MGLLLSLDHAAGKTMSGMRGAARSVGAVSAEISVVGSVVSTQLATQATAHSFQLQPQETAGCHQPLHQHLQALLDILRLLLCTLHQVCLVLLQMHTYNKGANLPHTAAAAAPAVTAEAASRGPWLPWLTHRHFLNHSFAGRPHFASTLDPAV